MSGEREGMSGEREGMSGERKGMSGERKGMSGERRAVFGLEGWRRTVSCGGLDRSRVGEEHTLMGWVAGTRDLGALVFVDLRDRDGVTQVVLRREQGEEAYEAAKHLRAEFVVAVRGKV